MKEIFHILQYEFESLSFLDSLETIALLALDPKTLNWPYVSIMDSKFGN